MKSTINSKILFNLLFALIMTVCLLAPDWILKLLATQNQATFSWKFTFIVMIFCLCASLVRSVTGFLIGVAPLFLMEVIQVHHLCFFGCPLHIAILKEMFALENMREIALEGFSNYKNIYFAALAIIIPYGLIIAGFILSRRRRLTINYMPVVLVALLIFNPIRAILMHNQFLFAPMLSRPSLYNSVNMLAYVVYNLYHNQHQLQQQLNRVRQPYQITPKANATTPQNIVLIIGESCNHNHMSLFGYHRSTTPQLEQFAQSTLGFKATTTIANAVTTNAAVALLLGVQREPGFFTVKPHNLFALARQAGYNTYWLSSQSDYLLSGVDVKNIGQVVTQKQLAATLERTGNAQPVHLDEMVVRSLNNIDFKQKNFLVVNIRTLHSPYQEYYAGHLHRFKVYAEDSPYLNLQDKRALLLNNSYDNAMLFFDYIITSIFQHIKQQAQGETWVFFVSDHAELLGAQGLYGHGYLDPALAYIPLLSWSINHHTPLDSQPEVKLPSQYHLAKHIAGLMGYDFQNPNEEPDVFYIQGPDILENTSFIRFDQRQQQFSAIMNIEQAMQSNSR